MAYVMWVYSKLTSSTSESVLYDKDFVQGSWKFSSSSCEREFKPGGAVVDEFKFTLNNLDGKFTDIETLKGKIIKPEIWYCEVVEKKDSSGVVRVTNNLKEGFQRGVYFISEVSTGFDKTIYVTAYSLLKKLDEPLTNQIFKNMFTEGSAQEIIDVIKEQANTFGYKVDDNLLTPSLKETISKLGYFYPPKELTGNISERTIEYVDEIKYPLSKTLGIKNSFSSVKGSITQTATKQWSGSLLGLVSVLAETLGCFATTDSNGFLRFKEYEWTKYNTFDYVTSMGYFGGTFQEWKWKTAQPNHKSDVVDGGSFDDIVDPEDIDGGSVKDDVVMCVADIYNSRHIETVEQYFTYLCVQPVSQKIAFSPLPVSFYNNKAADRPSFRCELTLDTDIYREVFLTTERATNYYHLPETSAHILEIKNNQLVQALFPLSNRGNTQMYALWILGDKPYISGGTLSQYFDCNSERSPRFSFSALNVANEYKTSMWAKTIFAEYSIKIPYQPDVELGDSILLADEQGNQYKSYITHLEEVPGISLTCSLTLDGEPTEDSLTGVIYSSTDEAEYIRNLALKTSDLFKESYLEKYFNQTNIDSVYFPVSAPEGVVNVDDYKKNAMGSIVRQYLGGAWDNPTTYFNKSTYLAVKRQKEEIIQGN